LKPRLQELQRIANLYRSTLALLLNCNNYFTDYFTEAVLRELLKGSALYRRLLCTDDFSVPTTSLAPLPEL
jgi:hypothetical protein